MNTPLILEIKGNSLDDGPGIRSVVFFKGCPLSCRWCHNPESKRREVEIAFDSEVCVGCGACMEVCPENALSKDNPNFINRSRCSLCFLCVENCPSGALSHVGQAMTINEILREVIKDKPFFDTSGGGVTLSGGEPTLFPEFTSGLLQAIRKEGIHTLVETCGMFDPQVFLQKLYPHINTIYFDIKLMDPGAHRKYCGVSNDRILSNFKLLKKKQEACGIEILPRTPLIPGITDTDENLEAIAEFLNQCDVKESRLLSYHPLWQAKNRKIGCIDTLSDSEEMMQFLPVEKIVRCKEIFEAKGIMVE